MVVAVPAASVITISNALPSLIAVFSDKNRLAVAHRSGVAIDVTLTESTEPAEISVVAETVNAVVKVEVSLPVTSTV